MERLKRCFSIFLAAIIMLASNVSPITVSAADSSTATATLSIVNKSAQPGDTVTMDVVIDNNPGILSATLQIDYDDELNLIDAQAGEAFSYMQMTKPKKYSPSCRFIWDGQECAADQVTGGVVLSLTFEVPESIEKGKSYAVKVSAADGDCYDNDLNVVDVKGAVAAISVIDFVAGDVNGDGKISVADIISLRRYLVSGYDITINEEAANVNDDGRINSADVILLRRYLAGGYGVTLLAPTEASCSHTLQSVSYQAATCITAGNLEYWYCSKCNKYFSDANGYHEITQESTVIAATGHTVVIDPAVEPTLFESGLSEGSHCSVCNTVIIPQETWDYNKYTVTYDISNGDSYLASLNIDNSKNVTLMIEGESAFLNHLDAPSGYLFLGWFTGAGSNATEINKIENIDHNIKLYAHWQKLEYQIQFKSDLIPVNDVLTYTVDTGRVLPTLSLDGYVFAGWTDYEGNKYTRIKEGTIPKNSNTIVLYANWTSMRNQAWTKNTLDDPIVIEDENTNTILFTYEIGEIRNIPASVIEDFGYINESGVSQTVTKEVTVSATEELMEAYTNTVEEATVDSSTWTLSKDWTESTSVSQEYCEQNGLTREEAESICKSDTDEYWVSNSQGGSHSTSTADNTQTYNLTTENNNTKSWSDDYEERKSNGTDTITYDSTDHTSGYDNTLESKLSGSGTVDVEAGFDTGIAKESVDYSVTIGGEVGDSRTEEDKSTAKTGSDTTTHGDDVTTMKGKAFDDTRTTQTGTVSDHSASSTNTSTWNTEEGRKASATVSKETSLMTTVSKVVSEKTGYGKEYINSGGESNSQGFTSSDSTSDTYSASTTYSTNETKIESLTYTTSNTKTGFHRWVYAGTAHVFATVGYNIETADYFVQTFSIMDDQSRFYKFEDYSYNDPSYSDNQCSVIPFSVPDDISEYVYSRTFRTDGLEVDLNGTITAYEGSDTYVYIPDYARVNNLDGSYTVVKVTGLSENAFQGNKNITGVTMSSFIEEIPDNAFKGCSNLWQVFSSATSIGKNAFADCPLLEEWNINSGVEYIGENAFSGTKDLVVSANNGDNVQQAISAGAKNIYIGISSMEGTLDDKTLDVPLGTGEFVLKGYGKSFSNLTIKSDAETTILNRININADEDIPLQINSGNVGLYQMKVNSKELAAVFDPNQLYESKDEECADTTIDLYGQVLLSSSDSIAVLARGLNLGQETSGLKTDLILDGNLVTCEKVSDIKSLLSFTNGKIVEIEEDMFEKMLHPHTLYFDANGGLVDQASSRIYNGVAIGTLPMPTWEYHTFEGWYTKAEGGEKVTDETEFSSDKDVTIYAHWTAQDMKLTFDPDGGSVTTTEMTVHANTAISSLPTPTKDYYDFKGWFTEKDGKGTQISDGYKFTTAGTTTLYAYWTLKASSDWVKASDVPDGAQILDTKWKYTKRSYTSSGSSSLSGWNLYDSSYVWGSTQGPVYYDPSNGERNVWSESYETGRTHYYRFYRYANSDGSAGSYAQSSTYWNYEEINLTYELTVAGTSGGYRYYYDGTHYHTYWRNSEHEWDDISYGTRWYYQDRVYTYYFYQDNQLEATSDPSGQSDVYNVVKYVKYRAK